MSSPTSPATGQPQDATRIRIRTRGDEGDGTDVSPTFDSEGGVSGRIEVKPVGENAWGTIEKGGWVQCAVSACEDSDDEYFRNNMDALVACREIGNELGYTTISGTALSSENTPDGSGIVWWGWVECTGSEETLAACSKEDVSYDYDYGYRSDIGITCKFLQPSGECKICPSGKFSDSIGPRACTPCPLGYYSETRAEGVTTSPCTACKPGTYTSTLGEFSCTKCPQGASTEGFEGYPQECKICPLGLVTDEEACAIEVCLSNEYSNNGTCEKCDTVMSTLVIFGSLLTFLVAAQYVKKIAGGTSDGRQKMIRLKILSTFLQTTEITTMVKISWPSIAFLAMPFKLPTANFGCMVGAASSTLVSYTYFMNSCGVLGLFALFFAAIRCSSRNFTLQQSLVSALLFLMMLWYTPILQNTAQWYDCFKDETRGRRSYMVSEPLNYCGQGSEGFTFDSPFFIGMTTGFISLFVVVGFPAFIVWKTKDSTSNPPSCSSPAKRPRSRATSR